MERKTRKSGCLSFSVSSYFVMLCRFGRKCQKNIFNKYLSNTLSDSVLFDDSMAIVLLVANYEYSFW
jgi:hypothetical protein